MKKLQTFRAALLASSPELAIDPQKVAIFAERGRSVSGGAPGKGWEYQYQATAIIQDFAGDVDAVTRAVLEWMREELPGVLKNPELAAKAFRFECELMANDLVDLQIEVDIDEPVLVGPDGQIIHPPALPEDPTERWLWQPTT